jgi:hypothetical protein
MQVGDFITVDGKQATIKARHAAGKHVQYELSDGRTLLDLHLRKDVELCGTSIPGTPIIMPVSAPPRKDFGRLGKDILPHAEFGEDSHD